MTPETQTQAAIREATDAAIAEVLDPILSAAEPLIIAAVAIDKLAPTTPDDELVKVRVGDLRALARVVMRSPRETNDTKTGA